MLAACPASWVVESKKKTVGGVWPPRETLATVDGSGVL